MAHTPGPWEVKQTTLDWSIQAEDGTHIIDDQPRGGFGDTVDKANAHLIASAPNLLQILESLLNRWDGYAFDGDPEVWRKQALEIIKKARGEE